MLHDSQVLNILQRKGPTERAAVNDGDGRSPQCQLPYELQCIGKKAKQLCFHYAFATLRDHLHQEAAKGKFRAGQRKYIRFMHIHVPVHCRTSSTQTVRDSFSRGGVTDPPAAMGLRGGRRNSHGHGGNMHRASTQTRDQTRDPEAIRWQCYPLHHSRTFLCL